MDDRWLKRISIHLLGCSFLVFACSQSAVSIEIYEGDGLMSTSHAVNTSEAFNNIKCDTDATRFINMNFTMIYSISNESLDFNLTTNDGYTVLHYSSSSESVLEELFLLGTAFVNDAITRIKGGKTVILKDDTKFETKAEFDLTQKKVTAHRKEADGENICAVVAFGNVTDFRLLIDPTVEPNIKDELEMAPLHWAAMFGDAAVIKNLLDRGADINIRWDRDSATPLHFAAIRGDPSIVSLLVENGADIDAKDDESMTVVHAAVFSKQPQVLKQLIELGANLTVDSSWGSTPLHLAAQRGYTHIIDILLDNGVDINAKNLLGKTPLHIAIDSHDKQTVRQLVTRGADVNMTELTKIYGDERINNLFDISTTVE